MSQEATKEPIVRPECRKRFNEILSQDKVTAQEWEELYDCLTKKGRTIAIAAIRADQEGKLP